MPIIPYKSDIVGALASSLCLVHCLLTPFLFIAHTCSESCHAASPVWWRWADYIFLVIAFFAVSRTSQTTSRKWIAWALFTSWTLLCFAILNERFAWFTIVNYTIYLPALALVVLHSINLRYCRCATDKCCA